MEMVRKPTRCNEKSEQEMMQQIVYNLLLYLPLKQLEVKNGSTIRDIVKKARRSYLEGNKKDIDLQDLELLEACLDEKSGISDIGEARMYYASFNKDVNDLVSRGVDRKQAEGIVNPEVLVTVVFVYDGSEKQGLKRNLCFTFRGTPGRAWIDNADMESSCTGSFQKDRYVFESLSKIGELAMIDAQDTLQLMYEGKDAIARKCRRLIAEGRVWLAGHSKGGLLAVLVKCIFPELNAVCFANDAPGPPPEFIQELLVYRGEAWLEKVCSEIFSINSYKDLVHAIGYTDRSGYFAKNVLFLGAPELDRRFGTGAMDYHYIRQLLRIGADGRVHLQPRTLREGALVEIVKDISHDLMHKAPQSRAEPMHVLLAAVQFGYAKKKPYDYRLWDYFKLGAYTGPGSWELLCQGSVNSIEWLRKELIAMKYRATHPNAVCEVLRAEWKAARLAMEEELLHLKQWKRAGERVKLYINRTKLVIRGELACGSLFSGEPEGFSLLAHDRLNRGLLELFKQGVVYSRNSTKQMCETLTDAAILSSLRWSGHQLFTPSGFVAQGKLRLSLKEPKNLSLDWSKFADGRAALRRRYSEMEEVLGSCDLDCYPLLSIDAGTSYPWKMAELLRVQHESELRNGLASLIQDRQQLKACILECCGVSSLDELETDIPGKRPLLRIAKQVLYDAREIEGILLNYAARLEKGFREQFVLLGQHESTGQGGSFETAAFLQSGNESTVSAMAAGEVGEAGIDYAAAEYALACAADVSLHCGSLLRDIEQLNERLSCLRYISVSRDGLSELSRLLGSWKSQQEEYREALGSYVMRCRETEEQFCGRCAGIASE